MNWKTIRLELARTEEFPEGSVSRSYLLRLPLRSDGFVDESAVRNKPAQATVRRFWPSEPDLTGYIVPTPLGWKFRYEPGGADDDTLFHLEGRPLRMGENVAVTEPDGRKLPFRVAGLRELH